jgi:beta-barrel assembly-enhancing protease
MNLIERRKFLRNAAWWTAALGAGSFLPALFTGCKALEEVTRVGAEIGTATGMITKDSADSMVKSTKAISKSFEDITPQQEYYIGRSIGAVILEKYPADPDAAANHYLNQVGQTLSRASDMPETFGGYHFLCMNSQEINALSAPGGLIFVTRGILDCCQNETAVAAVLAHEIGHVQAKHGLRAIKNSRITNTLVTIGVEGAKTFGNQELADLTKDFEGSINDISQTLINSGYSREYEFEADRVAIKIMRRVGYNPVGLVDMLQVMRQKLVPGKEDFASTHPSPESRILEIKAAIGLVAPVKEVKERQVRFESALKNI